MAAELLLEIDWLVAEAAAEPLLVLDGMVVIEVAEHLDPGAGAAEAVESVFKSGKRNSSRKETKQSLISSPAMTARKKLTKLYGEKSSIYIPGRIR